jgi:Rps23 Pro-64 3,4-dihydroxylase Tpa1-like proline 4-hydroxylase
MHNEYGSNNLIKIENNHLQNINEENCLKYFGEWVNNLEELNNKFNNAKPFEHVVIDNFLEQGYAEKLYELFPEKFENWYVYENPVEVKYTFDNINELPQELKNYFYYLSSNQITELFRKITNISNLEYDEYLHGAGLHVHPRHGRLNIHLDYEKHPFSGKERRLNVILILTKNWNPEWNGLNELWDKNVTECIKKTDNIFNRVILFKTNDISWHGLPEKIICPENVYRKSLAYYYVSPLNNIKDESKYRSKAVFVKRPTDKYDENIEELYKIRPYRRITCDDMKKYMPDWKKED